MQQPITRLTDQALLAILLGGDVAQELASVPLCELFEVVSGSSKDSPPSSLSEALYLAQPVIHAVKELFGRALQESLERGPVLSQPQAVKDYLINRIGTFPHEVFAVLLMDAQHRLIRMEELFRGTLTQASVYPREVVKLALASNAAAVIFSHNHPSGVAEPSEADKRLTEVLKSSLALVEVRVLDHIVVTAGSATSFAERGLL